MTLAYFIGFGTGAVVALGIETILLGVNPKLHQWVKRIHDRPRYRRASEEPIRPAPSREAQHRAELADWIDQFHQAEPPLDLSTPEGLAAAKEAEKLEHLPRHERRKRGLL